MILFILSVHAYCVGMWNNCIRTDKHDQIHKITKISESKGTVDQKADLIGIRFGSGITDTRAYEVHDEFLMPPDLSASSANVYILHLCAHDSL